MNPIVNCEENIGKIVGRRAVPRDTLTYASGLQKTLGGLKLPKIRKGVYRFHSHEEADQWLMDHLTRKQVN
jgi:hypothetical protein